MVKRCTLMLKLLDAWPCCYCLLAERFLSYLQQDQCQVGNVFSSIPFICYLSPFLRETAWYDWNIVDSDVKPQIKQTNIQFICIILIPGWIPGPSCSKLTTSLVNDSLKFTSSDTRICRNFLLKKMWVAFAVQKLLTFFQQKYQNIVYWIR